MTGIQHAPAVIQQRRDLLARRIRLFVTLTISWNVIEAVVALTAGASASSSALIGFGLDSIIEVSSAAAVAWQFAGRDPEAREKVALRVIAFSFFGLAAFVTVDALRSLLGGGEARHSTVGLVLAALSLAVMPLLSYAQPRRPRARLPVRGRRLQADPALHLPVRGPAGRARAEQPVRLVVGRPHRRLVIAGVAVKEGLEAWRGDSCACGPAAALHPETGPADESCGCGPGCADACCTDTGGATKSGDGNSAAPLLTIGPRPESSPTGNE